MNHGSLAQVPPFFGPQAGNIISLEGAISYKSFYISLPYFAPLEVMTADQVTLCAAAGRSPTFAHGSTFDFGKEFTILSDRFAELRNYQDLAKKAMN